ncbi:MAG: efflux system, outer rane lipoprotein CmeC [Burkholderiaceae bacterium]|nr:efflux system, outer rane lipoprotein CmeC [Burkholderiaceae bacterium]
MSNRYNQYKSISLTWAAVVLLSACSMAPRYQQPTVPLAPEFPSSSAMSTASTIEQWDVSAAKDLGWQQYFADARLQRLIELALSNNKDLRIAALNVETVRAQYAIARADRLPAISATGSATKTRVAEDLSSAGRSYISESYNVGLGVASFELDLFGRVKSLSDNALNQYFAQEQARDATQISLVATVAKAYFAERTAQANMDLSARVLQSREESKRLTDLKFKAGVISAVEVNEAVTQIETARADYAAAERSREQARNALALLIAQPLPEDLPPQAPLDAQFANWELPVGLPSDVLLQRPDIQEAEFSLKAANANIGAARAAFFPRITLIGSVGSGSTELSGLFTGGNSTWSFTPQVSLPIFAWGQNKANLDVAQLRKNTAIVQYEQAVQSAFRDVADAMVARRTLQQQYLAQQRSDHAMAERYRLVKMRFDHGVSSSLELLDAERSSYSSQQALLATQQTLLENRADVYKVLGGGLVSKNLAN